MKTNKTKSGLAFELLPTTNKDILKIDSWLNRT